MTKVKDSVCAECRWADDVFPQYMDWDIIEDRSRAGYQGQVWFIATNGSQYIFVEYDYGSCPWCDEWDRYIDEAQMKADMARCILVLDNEEQYKAWRKRLNE